jgi:hypothetical protein
MITYIQAIKAINPNAEFTYNENDLSTLQWLNGTTPIPVADIEAQIPILEAKIEQEKQDKETRKATAKQKLIDLGLTEEEIKALIGV